jgi:hypothetical protein
MPNKPTIAYIIVIISVLIAIAIIAVSLFKTPIQTIEQVATTTPAMATSTIPADPLAGIDLTFPEATQEIEGLVRVEQGGTKLSDVDAVENIIKHRPDTNVVDGRFLFIYREVHDLDCFRSTSNTMSCVNSTPEEVNEFIVTTNDRTKTLHRYQLTTGYSLLGFSPGIEVHDAVHYSYPEDNVVQFGVTRYEGDEMKEKIEYKLYIETGEIIELLRSNSTCTLNASRTSCGINMPKH